MKKTIILLSMIFMLFGATLDVNASESDNTETIVIAFNEKWQQLTYDEKMAYETLLQQEIANDLEIEIPTTVFYSENDGYLGRYSFTKHVLYINNYHIDNPEKIIKAICHEMRHAWQDVQIAQGTEAGAQYLENVKNYYSPANCTEEEYRNNNIVEIDAYAYHDLKISMYWNK